NESEARVPDDVNPIYVRTDAGELVPLSSVVDLKTVGASPELRRVDRLPAITLSANMAEGYDLGRAIDFVEQTVNDTLPL
ncbi:MAG TPA: hypothetical protein DFK55_01010, partial [Alcanivorax sp.]|nr:hypothetical protein [Alcanivorax sp.]